MRLFGGIGRGLRVGFVIRAGGANATEAEYGPTF